MPSAILARADALMLRHQQGSTSAHDDLPVLTDAVDIDDNIPTLEHEPLPLPPPPTSHPLLQADLLKLLAERVEQRLIAKIPSLIHEALEEILAEQEPPRP